MYETASNQRVRLLDATIELIATRGYENASVSAICARAGLSPSVFGELYEDREQCCLEAFDEVVLRASVRVLSACRRQESWADRVESGLAALLGFLDEQPLAARFVVVETFGCPTAVARRRAETLAKLVGCVDRAREQTNPPLSTVGQSAERLVATVLDVVHESLLSGSRVALADLAAPLRSLIVRPYLGESRARGEVAWTASAPGGGLRAADFTVESYLVR